MNKKIITIAGIVFALIFVVLLAVMMGTITNKANSANTKLVDTLEMSDGMELANYDNTTVKGSSVINAIKNGKSIGGDLKLFMYVETNEDTAGKVYGYGSSSGSGTALTGLKLDSVDGPAFGKTVSKSTSYAVYAESNSKAANYISESGDFDSSILLNPNGVTVGLYFSQN